MQHIEDSAWSKPTMDQDAHLVKTTKPQHLPSSKQYEDNSAGKGSQISVQPRGIGGGTVAPYAQDDDIRCNGRSPGMSSPSDDRRDNGNIYHEPMI